MPYRFVFLLLSERLLGVSCCFLLTQLDTIIPEFSFGLLIGRFINSGFVFYGGLFGALAGVKIYSAVRNMTV